MVRPRSVGVAFGLAVVLALAGAFAPHPARGQGPAGEALLAGVEAIATGGNPASLVLWGRGEALVVAPDGRVFAACTTLGRGRVVGLGHGGFVESTGADTPRFVANCLRWLARDPGGKRTLRLWGLEENAPAIGALRESGAQVELVLGGVGDVRFDEVDLVVGSPQAFDGVGRLDELRDFITGGGGMLACECAWGQLQLKRAESIDALATNALFGEAGLMWTGRVNSPVRDGVYPVTPGVARLANAEAALGAMTGAGELTPDEKELAVRVVGEALGVAPLDSALVRRADAMAARAGETLARAYREMGEHPLTPKDTPLARALIDLEARRAAMLPPEDIRPHPSHVAFPGPLLNNPRGRVTSTIVSRDPKPGWFSTGVWAPAGEPVTISIPARLTGAGLVAQIGAWRDPQDFDQRVRMTHAVRRFAMDAESVLVASPIGGPLYVDVPEGFEGELTLTAADGVLQPHFVLGETSAKQWEALRASPGPWAELESNELVLTLPSDVVRDKDFATMTKVMEHWDRVHGAMQSMEPRTSNHWPTPRKYRYVADRRLSWGYMYCPADDPIVIPTSAAGAMVDPANFDAEGPNELWGHYHEMGHAHQNPMWTFGGTGEVTVNIFTVRALHDVNGYALEDEAMRTNTETAMTRFAAHRAEGAPFEKWKSDPFLALQTYALLWHAFGFEAYDHVFAAYRALPESERPKNDDEERDLWMVMFSREVGRDLGPYFEAWGIPVSDEAREAVGGFEGWMPG